MPPNFTPANFTPIPKKPRKRSPQEVQQAQDEANRFIQEREKRVNRLKGEIGARGLQEEATKQIAGQSREEKIGEALESNKIQEQVRSIEDENLIRSALQAQPLKIGELSQEQQNKSAITQGGALESASAIGAGLGGATAGAGTGALIGTAVGGPVGTAVGAVLGGVGGFIGGTFTKISFSKRQNVKEAFNVFKTSKSNMDFIIDEVNAGRLNPSEAIDLWDEELANFYASERGVKSLNSNQLDRFLSDGEEEAVQIEAFRRRLPQKQVQFEQAILLPNPNNRINEGIDQENQELNQ